MDAQMKEHFPDRTWAEMDVNALVQNVRSVRELTRPAAKVMAVVKADAYGHGAVFCAKLFLENGADLLGVSNVDEARQLREAGIDAQILILGYTDIRHAPYIVSADITATVFSLGSARILSEEAIRQNKTTKIHIKLDTGMGRIGYTPDSPYREEIEEIFRLPNLNIEGVFSHFSTSDEENDYVRTQFARFENMLSELERCGIHFPIKHMCNSAAILRYPEYHLDMVRAGIILYGLIPGELPESLPTDCFRPVMTLKTSLVMVKALPPHEAVGYGRAFETGRVTSVGTIPVGYADGYSRRLSNKAQVLVRGHRVPVIGNICMDQSMIDLSDMQEKPGVSEEVVLFGHQKDGQSEVLLPAGDLAEKMGTIHYEVTCIVGKRVTRIYRKNGKIIHMFNTIW